MHRSSVSRTLLLSSALLFAPVVLRAQAPASPPASPPQDSN